MKVTERLGTSKEAGQPRRRAAEAVPSLRFPWPRLGVGLAALVVIGALAASLGPVAIPPVDVARILLERLPGVHITATWPSTWDTILWDIRFPRVALAGLVGASLSLSGATYQGVFRNPLADPYLIGVAGGAGLGATVVMLSPLPASIGFFGLVPLAAFLGGLLAVAVAYALSRTGGTTSTTMLILAGVAVASLTGAITTFLMMVVSPDVHPVLLWLMGSFNGSSWRHVLLVSPYLALASVVVLLHARTLNIMQLDREQAAQLGINVERVTLVLIATASLAAAAAVAVSGLIGFVGLIAPHVVRRIWGPNHRSLLPMSMVLGGAFLVLADLGARMALQPEEIPVGVVTALCGAPFFLYLLRKTRRWE